jgi:hypothetical protein
MKLLAPCLALGLLLAGLGARDLSRDSAFADGRQPSTEHAKSKAISLCDALGAVRTGEHAVLTVSAVYVSGPESSFLYDPACEGGQPTTWVEFAPEVQEPRKLRALIKKSGRAAIRFKGELYGPKSLNPDTSLPEAVRKSGLGYGHLNACATMLRVQSILNVEAVPDAVAYFKWNPLSQ